MTLADDVKSMYKHTKDVYDSLELLGATLPEDKNLENLASAFESVPVSGGYDPENPTLEGIKAAMQAGDYTAFPVGTEIPDTYNNMNIPLIVVAYQNVTTSDGQTKMGCYLQRKFVTDKGQKWNPAESYNYDYSTSAINTFLNGTYLDRCSDELKNIITEVQVPTVISSGLTNINAKFFLPSIEQMYGDANGSGATIAGKEGLYLPYWKEKMGLSTPSNSANDGRKVKLNNENGEACAYWLRTRSHTDTGKNLVAYIMVNGSINYAYVGANSQGILPLCVIIGE